MKSQKKEERRENRNDVPLNKYSDTKYTLIQI